MAAKAGAGASVSSGAGYQARIGGYLLVASFCDIELDITKNRKVRSISFETIEDIDDINLNLSDGRVIYIQAKAKIHYSISRDGELYLVLKQFEGQHCTRPNHGDHYCLVTGGRSSRKVTHDMRAALDAFRLTRNDQHFHRDQPKVLVQIIGDLLNALQAIQTASGRTVDSETAHDILRKTFVLVWDLESGDPMEQGAMLLLASRHFLTPAVLWGKIISDCVGHAKSRHTVDVTMAAAEYERFRAKTPQTTGEASDDLMRIDFGTFDFPVGREVVLVRMPSGTKEVAPRLMIMEFYRFDDDCAERIEFAGNTLRLTNGLEMQLIRRAATQTGLLRLIEANRALIGDEELTLVPLNSDENFERGTCAQLHRERLRQAALSNPSPLRCIHCGRPISSNRASMVEAGLDNELIVGLTHEACLLADDRVLATIRNQFFEEHPELVNFDPNAWFRALHGGQIAFAHAERARSYRTILTWGGRRLRGPAGPFVIEMLLEGGGREFVTVRNSIDRFSKNDADNFVEEFNKTNHERRDSNPFCYTEHTKAFGPRSVLMEQFGGKERLLVIEKARVRPYDERFAARYNLPGQWYAPLLFLRETSTGEAFSIMGSVALLTSPLSLANFLENWRRVGIPIPDYEVISLLSDRDFDDFMLRLEDQKKSAIVDPMVTSEKVTRFISGIPVMSIDQAGRLDQQLASE